MVDSSSVFLLRLNIFHSAPTARTQRQGRTFQQSRLPEEEGRVKGKDEGLKRGNKGRERTKKWYFVLAS